MERICELIKIIKDAQTEIADFRENCPHSSYGVGWWSWRLGAMEPQRICDRCFGVVPGVTEDEAMPFWETMKPGVTLSDSELDRLRESVAQSSP